jgi:hypothetical protein
VRRSQKNQIDVLEPEEIGMMISDVQPHFEERFNRGTSRKPGYDPEKWHPGFRFRHPCHPSGYESLGAVGHLPISCLEKTSSLNTERDGKARDRRSR